MVEPELVACSQKTIFHMPQALRKALGNGEKCDTFGKAMQLEGVAWY